MDESLQSLGVGPDEPAEGQAMESKELHDLRAAMRTLELAHGLIEMGYRFDDEKAGSMVSRLGAAINHVNDVIRRKILADQAPKAEDGLPLGHQTAGR